MRGIDTNIIVRFLTGDDPAQARAAHHLVSQGELFVATTILLEAEWVLRSGYGFAVPQIVEAFRAFAGLPGISLEDPALISKALEWTSEGMDFADALHLGRCDGCSAFMSFDRKLAKAAAAISDLRVVSPEES